MLSKLHKHQYHLFHFGLKLKRWRIIWFVYPSPQISVGKQVHSQQRSQIRKRPVYFRLKLQILQKKHGNQCCPNLDMHGISTGADKCFDFKVLLQGLEEVLNRPALFINSCNRRSCQFEVVGQKYQSPVMLFIIKLYQSQLVRTFLAGFRADKSYNRIGTSSCLMTIKSAFSFSRVTKNAPAMQS